jgi:hypothetical protein
MPLQALDIVRRDLFGKSGKDLALQAHPGLENIMGFRQARLRDRGALIGLHIDETLGMQTGENRPHYRPADAEPLPDDVFGQLVPWHQRLLDDRTAKSGVDGIAPAAGG